MLIDDVSFHGGAFPAHYGRQVGGIVSASLRAPSKRIRAEGNIRLFDAGAYVEAPLVDDTLHAFAAGRYAYAGPLLSLVAPDVSLSYWDYQGAITYTLQPTQTLRVFAFGTRDHFGDVAADGAETTLFDAEFHRVNLRFLQRPEVAPLEPTPRDAIVKLDFTFGYDASTLGEDASLEAFNYNLRTDVDVPISKRLRVRGGMDMLANDIEFVDSSVPDPEEEEDQGDADDFSFNIGRAFATRTLGTAGAYLDAVVRPSDELELVPGLRADIYAESDVSQVGLDPRAVIRIMPLSWLAIIYGMGVAHQRPALLISVPGVEPTGLDQGLQEALQLAHGVEFDLPLDLDLNVTGFFHRYLGLTDLTATCSAGVQRCDAADRSDGRAWGLEAMLQRSFSQRVGGVLAYTLSRSERILDGQVIASDFDRTHVFNAALGVDLGRRWHAGARFTVYTGRPYSIIAFDDPGEAPSNPA